MKMSNNLAKYEILNKEYLRSILDIRSLVKVYSADHSRPKSKPEIIFSISYCELIGSVEGIGFKRYHNPPEPPGIKTESTRSSMNKWTKI